MMSASFLASVSRRFELRDRIANALRVVRINACVCFPSVEGCPLAKKRALERGEQLEPIEDKAELQRQERAWHQERKWVAIFGNTPPAYPDPDGVQCWWVAHAMRHLTMFREKMAEIQPVCACTPGSGCAYTDKRLAVQRGEADENYDDDDFPCPKCPSVQRAMENGMPEG